MGGDGSLATIISLYEKRKKPWHQSSGLLLYACCIMFRVTSRLRFIEPQLPSLVEQPPEGKHWIHEIKHDAIAARFWWSVERPTS